ncbi:MAG TPA: DUF2285 domain-containing protein [Alphaproteobacteria bacterium]|nr:DUF2285 domain-containing protein [Alphaproteobacteria bacterium]
MEPDIADDVPWADGITAYDEGHLSIYLRLLDASADNASVEDMARIVFEIDPVREPERARHVVESHLRRARWMTETGYRHLLRQ